jgi:carotenoid cleavage dioxygenase
MDVEVVARLLTTLPADDDHPYRTGPWRPQRTEWRADDCEVIGEIPADLDGVYLRNTENPVHPALAPYHPFDGDGMLHLVGFRDGKAFYRNRFVRTGGFVAEQEAGRALWAPLTAPKGSGERGDGTGIRGYLKDASSTDVVVHNGVVKSSHFECGDLWRLDPFTLDTLGPSDQVPAQGVSAHPKVDEATGELLFFNYSLDAPHMHYGVLDPHDTLAHYIDVPLPGPRLPHDMTYTADYAIVNDLPMLWDEALMAKGVFLPRFHREMPTRLGVIPRRGQTQDIRWFEFEPTYVLHWTNAWQDGDELVVEGFFQHDPMPAVDRHASYYERMSRFISLDGFQSRLHRWRMNLVTGATSEESLSGTICEFGMINARSAGKHHRYTYAALGEPGRFLFNGLVRHDTATGAEQTLRFGDGVFGSETAVAPRGPGEDDAYLVTLTIDEANDCSECWVLDAARLSDGPIARIRLPERISSGTHATWAPGSAIPGWADADAWEARARV